MKKRNRRELPPVLVPWSDKEFDRAASLWRNTKLGPARIAKLLREEFDTPRTANSVIGVAARNRKRFPMRRTKHRKPQDRVPPQQKPKAGPVDARVAEYVKPAAPKLGFAVQFRRDGQGSPPATEQMLALRKALPGSEPCCLVDVPARGCRFPVEGEGAATLFCAEIVPAADWARPSVHGSYCAAHRRIAGQEPRHAV